MALTKINFKDYPDVTTQLNAENLNLMQDNAENAINIVNAQSITLLDDIEKYEAIEIIFDNFIPYKNYSYLKCLSNIPYRVIQCFSFNDGNGIITRNRNLGPITSGKTLPFENGYQNGNINNSMCVPLKIYGIEKL